MIASDGCVPRRSVNSTRRSDERRVCENCSTPRNVSERIYSTSSTTTSPSAWRCATCSMVRRIIARACTNSFFVSAGTWRNCSVCFDSPRRVAPSKSRESCRAKRSVDRCFDSSSRRADYRRIFRRSSRTRARIFSRSSNNVWNKSKRRAPSSPRSDACTPRRGSCWRMNARCNSPRTRRLEWRRRRRRRRAIN